MEINPYLSQSGSETVQILRCGHGYEYTIVNVRVNFAQDLSKFVWFHSNLLALGLLHY